MVWHHNSRSAAAGTCSWSAETLFVKRHLNCPLRNGTEQVVFQGFIIDVLSSEPFFRLEDRIPKHVKNTFLHI